MNHLAAQSADLPASSSTGSSETVKPRGYLARASLVLGICAALGAGILAGPHASVSHHAPTSSSIHPATLSVTATSGITGGPGNE